MNLGSSLSFRRKLFSVSVFVIINQFLCSYGLDFVSGKKKRTLVTISLFVSGISGNEMNEPLELSM